MAFFARLTHSRPFLNSLPSSPLPCAPIHRLFHTCTLTLDIGNEVIPITRLKAKPSTPQTSWAEAADKFFPEQKLEPGKADGKKQEKSSNHDRGDQVYGKRSMNRSYGKIQNNGSRREGKRWHGNVENGSIGPSSAPPKLQGDAIYGVGPIYAALHACRRVFYCLYVQENLSLDSKSGKKKDKKAVSWILENAVANGVQMKETSKHNLNMMVDNRPHQGLVLDVSPLELVLINSLEPPCYDGPQGPVWVALDEVTDPQNFGAVLRSAYFLGASGVVVCAKNSAPLTGVVSKASAGALEVMEVRSCRNMVKFLEKSMENGWRTIGTALQSNGIRLSHLPSGLPTILVLGSEGKGLRTNVIRACSHIVSIPGFASGRQVSLQSFEGEPDRSPLENEASAPLKEERQEFMAVESLNVSVAAGILINELLNRVGP